jgi:hypothetical protein
MDMGSCAPFVGDSPLDSVIGLSKVRQLFRAIGVVKSTAELLHNFTIGNSPVDLAVLEQVRNSLGFAADLASDALGTECTAELVALHLDGATIAKSPTSNLARLNAVALLGYLVGAAPSVHEISDVGVEINLKIPDGSDVAHLLMT